MQTLKHCYNLVSLVSENKKLSYRWRTARRAMSV